MRCHAHSARPARWAGILSPPRHLLDIPTVCVRACSVATAVVPDPVPDVQSVLYTVNSASGTLNGEVLNARIMSRSGSRVLLFIQRW